MYMALWKSLNNYLCVAQFLLARKSELGWIYNVRVDVGQTVFLSVTYLQERFSLGPVPQRWVRQICNYKWATHETYTNDNEKR